MAQPTKEEKAAAKAAAKEAEEAAKAKEMKKADVKASKTLDYKKALIECWSGEDELEFDDNGEVTEAQALAIGKNPRLAKYYRKHLAAVAQAKK